MNTQAEKELIETYYEIMDELDKLVAKKKEANNGR